MKLPEVFDFTQSNLQDYLDCPYRFYLRYILQTKWPALVVEDAVKFEQRGQAGARFHRLIQQYLVGVPEEQLTKLADADPEPDIAVWFDHFRTHVPQWIKGEKFIEITMSTNLNGERLVAKYDLILVHPDRKSLTIFDWKTSQKQPKKEWLLDRIQTRLYRFLLAQAHQALVQDQNVKPQDIAMYYWFANFPANPTRLPYDEKAFQTDQLFFESLIDEIKARDENAFEKTTDVNKCRYCVYRSHCDRGTHAGDLADFDDFQRETEELEMETPFEDIAEIKF
jgi:hypothetical protein